MDTQKDTLPISDAVSLQRLPVVKARTGLSRSEIYRRCAQGRFPKPIKLGERLTVWNSVEVSRWIAERIAERDAKAAA
ncbi:MAG: AlpA family phage regulatory protein [Rudaea sp.]|nr:AlpA family phage regulatory protein [Rudaea sp.]